MGISNVATSRFQLNVTFSNWETKTQKDRRSESEDPPWRNKWQETLQLTLLDFRMPWSFQLLLFPVPGNACLHTWVEMKWLIPLVWQWGQLFGEVEIITASFGRGPDEDKRWLISVCRINHVLTSPGVNGFTRFISSLISCVMHSRWCRGLWWWPRGRCH